MRIEITVRARRQYEALPNRLQALVDKQLELLRTNLRHRSIDAKKYDIRNDIWQGRVSYKYRFYFQIKGDTYVILAIIPHPK